MSSFTSLRPAKINDVTNAQSYAEICIGPTRSLLHWGIPLTGDITHGEILTSSDTSIKVQKVQQTCTNVPALTG